jgi:hypothetical protein
MATKEENKRKKVELYLMVATTCLVMAGIWVVLGTPETALAKKPVDDTTYYTVTMEGDLTIVGAFNLDPGQDPPPDWGRSDAASIRVGGPRPKICIATAFLGDVTLVGEPCSDGVIPGGEGGPNWGMLSVKSDATGVIVQYRIGETDKDTGKVVRRYALRTIDPVSLQTTAGSGTWPNGDGTPTVYTVTIPGPTESTPGTSWSLVQDNQGGGPKSDRLDTTLVSTQDTIITFTEYVPAP